jgi:hypothetical protein
MLNCWRGFKSKIFEEKKIEKRNWFFFQLDHHLRRMMFHQFLKSQLKIQHNDTQHIGLISDIQYNDTKHNDTRYNNIAIMLNVFALNVVMLNVVLLSVVMLNVFVLSVVAPSKRRWHSGREIRLLILTLWVRICPPFGARTKRRRKCNDDLVWI